MISKLNKVLIDTAKENVAGGTDSTMRLLPYQLPLVISKSEGIRVWDVEGKELIDMNMGYGPLLFGHRSRIVTDAIKKELELRGTVLGFIHELSSEVALLIKKSFPSIDLIRFSSSGTEVAQTAVRLARAYTNRTNIVVFEGHYHGSSNAVFHKYHAEIADIESQPSYNAIPGTEGMGGEPQNIFVLPWNNLNLLKTFFEEKGETIAAVIMEPVMGNAGVIAPKDGYLQGVRKLTQDYGSLLIFDEIISGYRVARGGAQERYGVQSDITLLSKAMNGGVPISAIGGRREVMNLLVEGRVFHGGVYSGNPMCLAATLAVQQEYDTNGEWIYSTLEDNSRYLCTELLQIFKTAGIPVSVQNVGAMISLSFVEEGFTQRFEDYREIKKFTNKDKYIKFQNELQIEGVYIHPNQFEPWYLSTLHTTEQLDIVLEKMDKVIRRINWSSMDSVKLHSRV
ncbi:aspartate aminotransferase family protein [Paenibacillus sp. FSL K6-1096]|uniref:aspartate aminotransferase family protein n=1 Tax=Paenibacillus sp. FSL K6-1096 TaxID=2921460 RepID=UPI0030EF5BC1